jgi:N-acetyl-anhydromuramyl-L-alanine amidase AmpD
MIIDTTSYRKDTLYRARYGYQARGGAEPSSIIIHTTNNRRKGTSFAKEAEYLRDSADVSAHFLIGKDGRIVQFLDPARWQAWHAGTALPAFQNARSIGIEHHVSVGETWTDAQHVACTWLVREMMRVHGIPPELIETHRAVARPIGRKTDPEGWGNTSFYAWRATLAAPPPPGTGIHRVKGLPIYQRQDLTGPVVDVLPTDAQLDIDMTYANGAGHDALGRGFLDMDGLEPL